MSKTLYGTYNYTGSVQSLSLPVGKYLFELHGAQGRLSSASLPGGRGGYTSGIVDLDTATTVNVYVGGGAGQGAGNLGGYNGGGTGKSGSGYYGGGGGGATDIRIGGTALSDRVLVAGGGGGQGGASMSGVDGLHGSAGGPEGIAGSDYYYGHGEPGTQADGYALGQGGNGGDSYGTGGGGGGYYGGYGSPGNFGGGGGGSSYIGGANGYIPKYALTFGAFREGDGLCCVYTLDLDSDDTAKTFCFSHKRAWMYLEPGSYSALLFGAGPLDTDSGKGGSVSGTFTLSSRELCCVYCGGCEDGFNGGGENHSPSKRGGGASDIRIGGDTLYDRVLVAGGGGRGSNPADEAYQGGDGGGLEGGPGGADPGDGSRAYGGTQTDGGAGPIPGAFGMGATATGYGTDGGGGWWGGGAGNIAGVYHGGAGGSSYYGGTAAVSVTEGATESGVNEGNGYVVISVLPFMATNRCAAYWLDEGITKRRIRNIKLITYEGGIRSFTKFSSIAIGYDSARLNLSNFVKRQSGDYLCCWVDSSTREIKIGTCSDTSFLDTDYAVQTASATGLTVETFFNSNCQLSLYKRTDNKLLLFVCDYSLTEPNLTRCYISNNGNGTDWTFLSAVESITGVDTASTPFLGITIPCKTNTGRLLLAAQAATKYSTYIFPSMKIYASDNDGATWAVKYSTNILQSPDSPGQIAQLPDGCLVSYFLEGDGDSRLLYSVDDGDTWLAVDVRNDFSDQGADGTVGMGFYYDAVTDTVFCMVTGFQDASAIYAIEHPTTADVIDKTKWIRKADTDSAWYSRGAYIYPIENCLVFQHSYYPHARLNAADYNPKGTRQRSVKRNVGGVKWGGSTI